MIGRDCWTRSPAAEIVVGLVLLLIVLGLRLWDLEADPPSDLAVSSSIYTDGPSYTMYARSFVTSGQLNPLGDFRHPFFIESSVTALAIVIFEALGTGLWQSNLVGVFYSFGSMILLFFFLRRTSGRLAAWLFLLMIGLNYNLMFYGCLPFLEHAMQFWASLALVIIAYSHRPWTYLLAGLSLAVGIFYGKIIGLVFLFPFLCFLVYQALHERKGIPKGRWFGALSFLIGLVSGATVWLVATYLPASTEVTRYVGEHTVGMYGAPEALQSVGDFLWAMVSFGVLSNLFPRMPLMALLATALILIVIYHAVRPDSWRRGFGRIGSSHVFVVASIGAFFGSLMIWNYRPLRYELALIYPVYAAAAMVLGIIWGKWRQVQPGSVAWPFYPFCFVIILVVSAQVMSGLADFAGMEFAWEVDKVPTMLIAALLTAGISCVASLFMAGRLRYLRIPGLVLAVMIPTIAVGNNIAKYVEAQHNRTYTLRDNSRDLSVILADDAVLSGPFGPAMALAAERSAVIHMFGALQVDTTLFERLPVTHLLLDKENANKAVGEYPEIMSQARHVCTYHVGPADVSLYRIAGVTGNAIADAYRPSLLEQAIDLRSQGDYVGAADFAERFVADIPDNITANLLLAELAEATGDFVRAEFFVERAARFSPTNQHLQATLGAFYTGRYRAGAGESYRTKAAACVRAALRLASQPGRQDEYRQWLEKLSADPDAD